MAKARATVTFPCTWCDRRDGIALYVSSEDAVAVGTVVVIPCRSCGGKMRITRSQRGDVRGWTYERVAPSVLRH